MSRSAWLLLAILSLTASVARADDQASIVDVLRVMFHKSNAQP